MRKRPEKSISVSCEYCDSPILVQAFRYKKFSHFFCDKECRGLASRKRVTAECAYCGEELERRPSEIALYEKQFCDMNCYANWKKENLCGKNNPRSKHKRIVNCAWCGSVKMVYPCFSKQHNFCNSLCESMWRSEKYSGKNNPNWQGGLSFTLYGVGFTKTLRTKIKERDDYTCQYCGRDDRELSVHHIDYDKEYNYEDNLISLCSSYCHSQTNFNREYWTRKFERIIRAGATTIPKGSTLQANGSGSARHPILHRRMMI